MTQPKRKTAVPQLHTCRSGGYGRLVGAHYVRSPVVGVAGVIVFGVFMVMGGVSRAKQLRRGPVAVALNEFGVSFYQHDPVAWETLREVRFGRVKPRLLYFTHPLYYIAFVPQEPAKPHSLSPRKRMTIRIYGTTRVLITQTVSPSGEDILAAVERLSDVPVRR